MILIDYHLDIIFLNFALIMDLKFLNIRYNRCIVEVLYLDLSKNFFLLLQDFFFHHKLLLKWHHLCLHLYIISVSLPLNIYRNLVLEHFNRLLILLFLLHVISNLVIEYLNGDL